MSNVWPGAGLRVRPRGIEICVKPTFPVLLILFLGVGWVVTYFAAAWVEAFGGPTPQVTGWLAGVVFAGALLGAVAYHEAGHAFAGAALGHRLLGVRLSMRPSVRLDYDALHGWRRVFVSAAGPVAEAVAGTGLILSGGGWSEPVALAGWLGLLNAALSLFWWAPETDGRRIFQGLWDIGGPPIRRGLARIVRMPGRGHT